MSKRIATTALLLAVALVLGYFESLLFHLPGVPGLKLGLANITVLLALDQFGAPYALGLSVGKAVLTAFLFGNPVALLYSLFGSVLSWAGMSLGKRGFGVLGVSVIGSVLHNAGQLAVACLLTQSTAPIGYAPILLAGGTLFGALTGLCAAGVLRGIQKRKAHSS